QFISKAARSTSTARESKTAPRMAASAAASIKTVRLTVALAAARRAAACGLVLAQRQLITRRLRARWPTVATQARAAMELTLPATVLVAVCIASVTLR